MLEIVSKNTVYQKVFDIAVGSSIAKKTKRADMEDDRPRRTAAHITSLRQGVRHGT